MKRNPKLITQCGRIHFIFRDPIIDFAVRGKLADNQNGTRQKEEHNAHLTNLWYLFDAYLRNAWKHTIDKHYAKPYGFKCSLHQLIVARSSFRSLYQK